jgi:hypothetical protein
MKQPNEEERERQLREVALNLMRKDRGYFGTFPIDVLISWLEDRNETDHRVLCAYCDLPLLDDNLNSFNGTADHLLPQKTYPELDFNKANGNSVACCSRCNWLKAAWDPNTKGSDPIYDAARDKGKLDKDKRKLLINRARAYVQGKLKIKHTAWEHWVAACKTLSEI